LALLDLRVRVSTVRITDRWRICKDGDPRGLILYERHYSAHRYADRRERRLFVGPGEKIVLLTDHADALFVWRKFRDDSGQVGVNCAVFRNESPHLSIELILEAERVAHCRWPGERLYTYVNPKEVLSRNPGYCFPLRRMEAVRPNPGRPRRAREAKGVRRMLVMPSNNTCWLVHYWAGRYGGLGHLISPERGYVPMPHLPYALDNGAYGAFTRGEPWDPDAFERHIERYAFSSLRPLWCVVPDVVADAAATLVMWDRWAERIHSEYHLPLAVAVQDGMSPADVRALDPKPEVVFVGGSTAWKWKTAPDWCAAFPRVHVGRVNTDRQLAKCLAMGAESCDGTGWFRGRAKQIAQLGHFLREQAGRTSDADREEVEGMVFHSRTLNRRQGSLPLEVGR